LIESRALSEGYVTTSSAIMPNRRSTDSSMCVCVCQRETERGCERVVNSSTLQEDRSIHCTRLFWQNTGLFSENEGLILSRARGWMDTRPRLEKMHSG